MTSSGPACSRAPDDGAPDDVLRERFARDGFLVLEGFLDPPTCERLIARAGEIVAAFDATEAASVFSTTSQAHAQDDYFLTSGDKIRCFFEEEAFDTEGNLRADPTRAINKIGHALHDLDPDFGAVSHDPRLARLTAGLGIADPLLLQSMYIFKQPRIGGEVVWHQDATFLYSKPQNVIGLWFALQDATIENGCLEAVPGAHRGPLRARFKRDGGGTITEPLDATPWPEDGKQHLAVPQGTLIVLHGLLPHRSGPNRSARSRQAYTLHVIDGASAYPADNWLRRGDDMPLRGFA